MPDFARERSKLAQPGIVQRRDDQQDAIRAQGARFIDLIRVDGEILAQHRQRAGGAGLLQMFIGTLEKIAVGEHRQAGGAMALVALGDFGGVKIGAQQALCSGSPS